VLLIALAAPLWAGPVEFGMAEVQRAIEARGLPPRAIRFNTEISLDAPETYQITPFAISGGDLRGLMYGLLTAADQIRDTGHLARAKGAPAVPLRSVQRTISAAELDQEWCSSHEYWKGYVAMLARNRFNRLALILPAQNQRSDDLLRLVSQLAAEYAVDLALGIRPQALAPEALKNALAACPALRSIEILGSADAPPGWPRDLLRVAGDAGRRIAVDLRAADPSILDAAREAHVAVRISAPYGPGGLGRPYQPPEGLLDRPRFYDVYWDLTTNGIRRWLLWGDPEFVRRAATTLALAGSTGFEIDAPGWKDFDRHWLFYLLWGRLTYDPKTPEKTWITELQRRYGDAASDILAAYQAASGALGEIVAANLAVDLSPGLPLDSWRDARTGDARFIESLTEAVENRRQGAASAKETPIETAAFLADRAARIEAARARVRLPETHREWTPARSDFEIVELLARYHAYKRLAAAETAWFDETGDGAALPVARREIEAAQESWEKLAAISDAAVAQRKSPEVSRDVQSIRDREEIFEQYGLFEFGADFGPAQRARSAVTPRFEPADPATKYSSARGYGWVGDARREAYAAKPGALLCRDAIRGTGPQIFRIHADEGAYQAIVVTPDGPAAPQSLRARSGALDVKFPEGEWAACGLVVKRESDPPPGGARPWPKRGPRPSITHTPVVSAPPNRPLALSIAIQPATGVKAVRLHYRPLNQLEEFKTFENAGARGAFTIPARDVAGQWDLLYYFEILSQNGSGWFESDPYTATPYYVVRVEAPPAVLIDR